MLEFRQAQVNRARVKTIDKATRELIRFIVYLGSHRIIEIKNNFRYTFGDNNFILKRSKTFHLPDRVDHLPGISFLQYMKMGVQVD